MKNYVLALALTVVSIAPGARADLISKAFYLVLKNLDSQSLSRPDWLLSVNKSIKEVVHRILRERGYYSVSKNEDADLAELLNRADNGSFARVMEFDASLAKLPSWWNTDESESNFSLIAYFRSLRRLVMPGDDIVDIGRYHYKNQDVQQILWGTLLGQIAFRLDLPLLRTGTNKMLLPPLEYFDNDDLVPRTLEVLKTTLRNESKGVLLILPIRLQTHWVAVVIQKTFKESECHVVFGFLELPNRMNDDFYQRILWALQRGEVTPVDHFSGIILVPPEHDTHASGPVVVESIFRILRGQKVESEPAIASEQAESLRWRHLGFMPLRSISPNSAVAQAPVDLGIAKILLTAF